MQHHSIVTKIGRQPKCPSIDEHTKKMWYTHTQEYYSAFIKKKEILTNAITWMNPEDIILGIISQSWKEKYCIITLI